jgi:hypothetical protein
MGVVSLRGEIVLYMLVQMEVFRCYGLVNGIKTVICLLDFLQWTFRFLILDYHFPKRSVQLT